MEFQYIFNEKTSYFRKLLVPKNNLIFENFTNEQNHSSIKKRHFLLILLTLINFDEKIYYRYDHTRQYINIIVKNLDIFVILRNNAQNTTIYS